MLIHICTQAKRISSTDYDLFDTVRTLDNVPDAFWKIEYDEINVVKLSDMLLAIGNAFQQVCLLTHDLASGLSQSQYSRYLSTVRELRTLNQELLAYRGEFSADEINLFLIPQNIATSMQD